MIPRGAGRSESVQPFRPSSRAQPRKRSGSDACSGLAWIERGDVRRAGRDNRCAERAGAVGELAAVGTEQTAVVELNVASYGRRSATETLERESHIWAREELKRGGLTIYGQEHFYRLQKS